MTEYRFTGECVLVHFASSPDWQKAMALTVYATTREDASRKARAVLGEPEARYLWKIRWNSIEEVR